MTPKQKEEKIKSIEEYLISCGYKKDRFNTYKKTINDSIFRYKLNEISIRKEVKHSGGWVRIASGYYRDIVISNNSISGLTR